MTWLTRILAVLLLIFLGGVDFQFSHLSGAAGAPGRRARVPSAAHALAIRDVWLATESPKESKDVGAIGRGKGIIFSPDLGEPGNRDFYRALGFAYFEDPDWHVVLEQLKAYNHSHPDSPVEVLLIQSHGTNGDALKLQNGNQPDAPRSYISAGGLLEQLEGTGVRTCLLAACNAGRLFRPENFHSVKPDEGNRLFEPATLGVINASADFDQERSGITIARRAESHLEVISECRLSEFSPATQSALNGAGMKVTTKIAVPEMLIQLLLADERLHLVADGFEIEKSRTETNDDYREHLISRFLRFVNTEAANKQKTLIASASAD
jgi:hypothetical protein